MTFSRLLERLTEVFALRAGAEASAVRAASCCGVRACVLIPRYIPPFILPRQSMPAPSSDPLHRQRYALADPDAHRAERPPAARALELVHRGRGEARTA